MAPRSAVLDTQRTVGGSQATGWQHVVGAERNMDRRRGLALLAGFFLMPEASYRWAFLIGIVPLVTGLARSCPLYSILGVSTCRTS